MRLVIFVASLCLLTAAEAAAASTSAAKPQPTNIPPEELRLALQTLARDRNFQIVYREDLVRGIKTRGAHGNLTAERALAQLLKGTGLTYRYLAHGGVTIAPISTRTESIAPGKQATNPSGKQGNAGSSLYGLSRPGQVGQSVSVDPPAVSGSDEAAAGSGRQAALGEIVVTAQRRKESILKVPVIEAVISTEQIHRLQVNDLADVETLVPGLDIGKNILALGTQISLRGVGTTAYDQGIDSSVSLNVDGVGMSNGLAMQSAMFDVASIQVLKGPQALYWGKNSTAGVIVIQTADPTDKRELTASVGYEFESINPVGELIISGPLTDTLKVRLAGQYSFQEGYFFNDATALLDTGALPPAYKRAPHGDSYQSRLTAIWDPSSRFTARLKINLVGDNYNNEDVEEAASCPSGTTSLVGIPFMGGGLRCQLGRTLWSVDLNPTYYDGLLGNGVPFVKTYQHYGDLELTYLPGKDLTLTSLTGYYHVAAQAEVNAFGTSYAGSAVGASNKYSRHDLTEDMRLDSDFETPVNFMVDAYYQSAAFTEISGEEGDAAYGLPSPLARTRDEITIKTYSGSGQLRWKIVPQLEITAGARYDDETRNQSPFNVLTETPVSVPVTQLKSDTWSPEYTLRYTPTDTVTWFAAYKIGYKSGSFGVDTPVTPGDQNSFGPEKVHGGELGLKSLLLRRRLALNVAPYYYVYDDLQVGIVSPGALGQSVNKVVNAAEATTYGLDIDGAYRPETIQGLTLRAALNWNHARWGKLTNVPCYSGQTIYMGCTETFDASTGLYLTQDLTGTPLVRAPDWSAQLGLQYDVGLAGDYELILNESSNFSSRYETFLATDVPDSANYQGSFIKLDLGLTLQSPEDHWEFALLTKDLNDKVTTGNCALANLSNEIFGGSIQGGTTSGPAGVGAVACFPDVGRQIWLRVTAKAW